MNPAQPSSTAAPIDILAVLPGGTGQIFNPESGVISYFLRGVWLEVGNPIYVKSLGQLGIIVSDCACNRGTMFHFMTSTITSDPANYLLPHEAGYGA